MSGQASTGRYCAGCVMAAAVAGRCTQCGWSDAAQSEGRDHLPRHYLLLGRYYMGRVLGQGGFGVTYLARDLTLRRPVAIKEYLPHEQCTRHENRVTIVPRGNELREQYALGLERFLEEARSLAQFEDYPGIVHVMDFSEANGTAYLVMAFLDGITLKQHMANRGGKISSDAALQLMMPVLDALREVHRCGILHRDVSPDNIFLTRSGHVKLLDFGAARYAIGEQSKSLSTILKPGYAPEEQYRSRGRQGPWTDVYASAATLYRCITGHVPPTALDRMSEDELVTPSAYCPDLSPVREMALLQGLAVRAENRFRTVEQFQQAILGTAVSQDPSLVVKEEDRLRLKVEPKVVSILPLPDDSSKPWSRSTPLFATLAVAAVVLAAVLIWQIALPSGGPSVVDGSGSGSTQQASVTTPVQQPVSSPPGTVTQGQGQPSTPAAPSANGLQGSTPDLEQLLRSGAGAGPGTSPKPDGPPVSAALLQEERSNTYQSEELAAGWAVVDKIFDDGGAKWGDSLIHISLENKCDKTIRVANKVRMPDEPKWLTIGWRIVGPAQTINTHYITRNETVYSYGETLDGAITWSGSDVPATASDATVSDVIFAHGEDEASTGTGQRKVSMFPDQFTTWGTHAVIFECK